MLKYILQIPNHIYNFSISLWCTLYCCWAAMNSWNYFTPLCHSCCIQNKILEGAVFLDFGTDLGSGRHVPGMWSSYLTKTCTCKVRTYWVFNPNLIGNGLNHEEYQQCYLQQPWSLIFNLYTGSRVSRNGNGMHNSVSTIRTGVRMGFLRKLEGKGSW